MSKELSVTIDEIREVFSLLIEGDKSREETASWANQLKTHNDNNQLIYLPPQQERLIKECLIYLCGVDMKDLPDDQYLHFNDDFKDFFHMKMHH